MKRSNLTWILLIALLATVVTALAGYDNTFGEPDMGSMVVGIVYGAVAGDPLAGGLQYGMPFSFGYYQLLYALIPAAQLANPDEVTRVINQVGLVFAALFALGLGLLLSRLLERGVALFVTAAFLFSPLALPFLASGHPFIGACAFLFLACWLVLLAADAAPARRAGALLAALAALVASLVLRGDIALALPFVPALAWAASGRPLAAVWRQLALVCVVVAAAFACFLLLQWPYVAAKGGAGGSLMGFVNKFVALDRLGRGLVVFCMTLGAGTGLALALGGLRALRGPRPAWPVPLALLALALPSLLFWLPNPQPARHFLFPVLAAFILVGLLWAPRLASLKQAAGWAALLVLGNQALAEAVRPLIVRQYQWSYPADDLRRATQQVPIGLFPLDQRANATAQQRLRAEARRLAAARPQRLLLLADSREYILATLLATDPTLRLAPVKVGPVDALLLSNSERQLYVVEKRPQWPRDTLAIVQALPQYAGWPIYVQPSTIARYDHATIIAGRAFHAP